MENILNEIKKQIENKSLYQDRIISYSKSLYRKRYPYNKVIFNANIFMYINNKSYKIWYGDIDVTLEGHIIKEIAKENNITLFILSEFDGRWGQEENHHINLEKKCVWNTNMNIEKITKSYIEKINLKREEEKRISRIANFALIRAKSKENKNIKISDLKKDYPIQLEYPEKYVKEKINELLKEIKVLFLDKNKKPVKHKGILYNKYFKEYGYFSYYILETYLQEKLNLNKKEIIDPSSVWISRKLNKNLRKIDLLIEKIFDEEFNYGCFGRYVTCNYCVPSIFYSKDNLYSYKDNILYIRESFSKQR